MVSNTGAISFILYGIFIVIAILGLFIAIYSIKKGNIPAERLDKIIDLSKYTIVSVALATIALIVTNLFKEREQELKELEYFDRYADDVKKEDLTLRDRLSKYFSIVAPSGNLKKSWKEYYDTTEKEIKRNDEKKAAVNKFDSSSTTLTTEELDKKIKLQQEIQQSESPLVSYNVKPTVYIQISDKSQMHAAKILQANLLSQNYVAPGVENVGAFAQMPPQFEVRYYKEEDMPDAVRLISIIKNQGIDSIGKVNETPQKIVSGKPGYLEIWFPKVH